MYHPRRTKRGLVALAAVAMLLVPAAIAWACNPNAQLVPNKAAYAPGESMSIAGSYFPSNAQITITSSAGPVATATTNQSGAFVASMTAPTAPGNYTLTANRTGTTTSTQGLPKVASFSVAAPTVKTAPAPVSAPAPTARGERDRSFVEPGVSRSPVRSVAGTGGSGGGGGGQPVSGTTGGVAGGGTTVVGTTGVPVFAGSVAPAQATFASAPAAASTRATDTAPRSTGRAAATDSDVWSGFANGRTPSLTSDAADAPDSDTGSGLGLGIGLLAVGLLALVAGLTAAEVRRRRASA